MRLKRENKGFSLVELIVVIAIFSVVGVVVGGFLVAASRSYSVSANELDIQEEAQLVANQMQEMILDTSLGISYQYVVTDATGAELIDYMENDAAVLPAGDLTKKDLYIYGNGYYYHIFWDKEKAELYLVEYVDDGSGYAPADGMPTSGVLFGEFISDFSVDLSNVASNRMVSFNITFKKNGSDRDYLVTRNVSLRNDVMTNKSAEDVYNAVSLEFEPVADGITVSPSGGTFLWPGEAQPFMATLTCSKGGVPSQDVTWTVTSGDGVTLAADTGFNAGNILQISANENSSKINIEASARGYDYTSNTEKTLKWPYSIWIDVGQIRNLSIVDNGFETSPVSAGGTYNVKVKMEGENLDGRTVTDAGGIVAQALLGNEYVTINSMSVEGLTATFNISIKDNAPKGSEIALSFRAAKPEFADVYTNTVVYKVGGSNDELFKVSSKTGTEWLRLGKSITTIEFSSEDDEDTYCDVNGMLREGYYIRYTYRIYDSNYNLINTAYTLVGTNNVSNKQDYISSFTHPNQFTTEAWLNDKLFLQSGTIVVSAQLCHNTSGSEVIVGSSDNLSYFVPQATISFKRAEADDGLSNMKVYVTSKDSTAPIYISFPTGFAATTYKIDATQAVCTPTELGGVSTKLSDITKNKIVVTTAEDAEYKASANNVLNVTYGGLKETVSVILTSPNVTGTDYYVPVNMSEWTYVSTAIQGSVKTDNYIYYIDDSHKMIIHYKNGVVSDATFYSLESVQWVKGGSYTMNKINKTWELATP